jgi:endonuclease YncB( thermonuclease family)
VRVSKALCFALLLVSCQDRRGDFRGRVVNITDGDTISVMHSGKAEEIRLNGIDCPERGQPFGKRAREFTSVLALGKDVTVKVKDQDRYGRTVAHVILPDGKSINHELVKAGYAWWDRNYAPHDQELKWLEKYARQDRRGLWTDPHAIPPWEFRKQRTGVSGVH